MIEERTLMKLVTVMTSTGPRKIWQGHFVPHNPLKYKGKHPIKIRSSWEYKFMQFVDKNPSIIEWSSESIAVQYFDPTKPLIPHRYYVDFSILVKDKTGAFKKYYIEIKPKKETIQPVPKQGKSNKKYVNEMIQYTRNVAKWKAAVAYAKQKNASFMILTEEDMMV